MLETIQPQPNVDQGKTSPGWLDQAREMCISEFHLDWIPDEIMKQFFEKFFSEKKQDIIVFLDIRKLDKITPQNVKSVFARQILKIMEEIGSKILKSSHDAFTWAVCKVIASSLRTIYPIFDASREPIDQTFQATKNAPMQGAGKNTFKNPRIRFRKSSHR